MQFDFNAIWQLLLLLSVLVVVHEYGHFAAARAFGVKVHEFSVGFGPLIGKFNWKGVQYSFRWILLGGFCKIAGMDIALEGSGEKDPDPEHSFAGLSLWKKVVVIGAGPVFNLLLAVVLMFVIAAFVGVPSSGTNMPIIEQATPGTPAFEAGLQPGDRITAINGQPVKEWMDISRLIKESGAEESVFQIERQGKTIVKKITPMYNPVEKKYMLGIIGVTTEYKTVSVLEAAKYAVTYPWFFTKSMVMGVGMMIRGEIKGGGMGPIGMVAAMEQYTRLPIYHTLMFAVFISLSLFIFNMLPLPLPLLDGGWITILLLERLIRREFNAEQKAVAQFVGLMLIAFLFIVVTYGDILTTIRRFFGG